MKKTIEDTSYSFDVALAWAISAKNTLHSVHGYSPNQLVFGRNPNLPSFLKNKLPALEGISTIEVVVNNPNAMHAARKLFIACQSSEKLRCAHCHWIWTNIVQSYKNFDAVFYKRNIRERCLGPGTLIGWEHKQVLVKHGSTYVRVHLSHLVPYPEVYQSPEDGTVMEQTPKTLQKGPDKTPKVSIFEANDVDKESPNENTKQHKTVTATSRPPTQNSILKKIWLPKPGQVLNASLPMMMIQNGENLMSQVEQAKNKHLMNVVMMWHCKNANNLQKEKRLKLKVNTKMKKVVDRLKDIPKTKENLLLVCFLILWVKGLARR